MSAPMSTEHEPASSRAIAPVRGIGIIVINVSDAERSIRFYKEVLGFAEGEQMLSPGTTLQAGDAVIYIADGREGREEREHLRFPEISLMLVVRGLKEASDRLRDAGIRFIEEYSQAGPHFASCSIADPDGNVIELVGQP